MPLMSSPRSSYAIEIVGTRFVYVEWGAHDLLAIDTNVSISYKSIYVCVCVCIYTKSTSSLWHLANAAADVDVVDVPCGMPRSLAGAAACCCCCLLLLPVSPGVVGVFLARAAI